MTKKWQRNDQEMAKKWPRNDQEMTMRWPRMNAKCHLWLLKTYRACGQYNKHVMLINDTSSGVIKWSLKLIDAARGVIYDRHMFIVQATDVLACHSWTGAIMIFYNNLIPLILVIVKFFTVPSHSIPWGHIFSCVQPFYEQVVSDQERSVLRSLWV
jgi:hypothetical protein